MIENVRRSVSALKTRSSVMARAREGGCEIVGGEYDLATGVVTLLEP